MKPLFIPLKAHFYEMFESGDKTTEYRVEGPRWNDKTCVPGRPVVLSKGYGKSHRLSGRIESISYDHCPGVNVPGWKQCYGSNAGTAICIKITEVKKPMTVEEWIKQAPPTFTPTRKMILTFVEAIKNKDVEI